MDISSKRIIFAGTPDFAATHLKALIEAKFNIVAVYSQMDRPAGRGHKLMPSSVKTVALEHNIPVYTPLNFKEEGAIETFQSLNADIAVVVAYGLLLPDAVLKAPRLGCINVHGSLLPKWRGAAPIQRALLSGEDVTGVTIMQLVHKMDAGPILHTATMDILPTDTSGTLFERMAEVGAKTLVEVLPKILNEELTPVEQDESQVTYAAKITKEESALNYSLSAKTLALNVRGLNPWPIATTTLSGTVFKVFETEVIDSSALKEKSDDLPVGAICEVNAQGIVVKCSEDYLVLKTIQAPGKGRVAAADFARSKRDMFTRGICFE